MRLLGALALLKGLGLILVLIGVGLAYLIMGNTPARFVGFAPLLIGVALGFNMVRSFAKRPAKPS
jgi:hypothetical protein